MDCSQNIKGSGQGESRACRFQQRIAVMLEGELGKGEVYQVTLPSTSIFGDGERDKWPLQAYARHLKAHNESIVGVVTEMRLDINSPTPKVTFRPVRGLPAAEIEMCVPMVNHEDTVRAITLNVSQFDAGLKSIKDEFAPASASIAAQKAAPVVEVVEAEIEEPKVVVKKTTAAPTSTVEDLGVVISDWDDE